MSKKNKGYTWGEDELKEINSDMFSEFSCSSGHWIADDELENIFIFLRQYIYKEEINGQADAELRCITLFLDSLSQCVEGAIVRKSVGRYCGSIENIIEKINFLIESKNAYIAKYKLKDGATIARIEFKD